MKIDELRTPCYVIDEGKLTENLLILNGVMQRTGARIVSRVWGLTAGQARWRSLLSPTNL